MSQTASGAMTIINSRFGFGLLIPTGEFNHEDVSCVILLNYEARKQFVACFLYWRRYTLSVSKRRKYIFRCSIRS